MNVYRHAISPAVLVISVILSLGPAGAAQQDGAGTPVHMVVTVEPRQGSQLPVLYPEDVRVDLKRQRAKVTNWVAAQGEQGKLELYVLLDDSSDPTGIGPQISDLKSFLTALPESTSVTVGYMQNGRVAVTQKMTTDHAAAAKAVRLPLGTTGGSPYDSVDELLKSWPQGAPRREVLMISDGVDPLFAGPDDPYLATAIERLQRAGVVMYTIYARSAGHFGHSYWRLIWGQNNLSQMAEETGGESYFQALHEPIAFAPYLKEISNNLSHQYLLTFQAPRPPKSELQPVRVFTEVPNADLVAPNRVWVPAQ